MRMVFPNGTSRLLDELSTDFNTFFESIMGEDTTTEKVGYTPRMDFEELEDHFRFAIDVPGVAPEDIHVDVEDDHVAVHGTRHQVWDDSSNGRRRTERVFGDFKRLVRLPSGIDKDSVAADYAHGVLTVTIPKSKKESRRVTISNADSIPTVDHDSSKSDG